MISNEQTLNELDKLFEVTTNDLISQIHDRNIAIFGSNGHNNSPIPPALATALESIHNKLDPLEPENWEAEATARLDAGLERMRVDMANGVDQTAVAFAFAQISNLWAHTNSLLAAEAVDKQYPMSFDIECTNFDPLDPLLQRVSSLKAEKAAMQSCPPPIIVNRDHPILKVIKPRDPNDNYEFDGLPRDWPSTLAPAWSAAAQYPINCLSQAFLTQKYLGINVDDANYAHAMELV